MNYEKFYGHIITETQSYPGNNTSPFMPKKNSFAE